jgi:hypothetical protein
MKNLVEFLKKYKIHILSMFLFIFLVRSCSKSGQVNRLGKLNTKKSEVIDSLKLVIEGKNDTINNISEVIKQEKIKVHTEYDNYISEKDRGEQLMELHKIVKNNLKELSK